MKKVAMIATMAMSMAVWGTAMAIPTGPVVLVGFYQRSSGGTLSSLAFKAGAAQGCPNLVGADTAISPGTGTEQYKQPCYNPTPPNTAGQGTWMITYNVVNTIVGAGLATWNWNSGTSTLTGTGLLWATSYISSNPNNTQVVSDKMTNLSILANGVASNNASASAYECIEGTFLATVYASACKNINFNSSSNGGYTGNGIDESIASWNVGAVAKCVNATINGGTPAGAHPLDDYSLKYRDPTGDANSPLDATNDGWPGNHTLDPNDPEYNYHQGTPYPRGLEAQTANQAGAGCAATSGAMDLIYVYQNDANYLILSNNTVLTNNGGAIPPQDPVDPGELLFGDNCYLFGTGTGSACGIDHTLASVSYMIFSSDSDSDGIGDPVDNCPSTANSNQWNSDNDALGNACDPDDDNDGLADASDNCQWKANNAAGNVAHTTPPIAASQFNQDGDATFGNACDGDLNNSGTTNTTDYTLLRAVLSKFDDDANPTTAANARRADMNASGSVTTADYTLLRNRLGTAPGP